MKKTAYLIVIMAIMLSSCASIVSKSSTMVGIDTDPQGATVQILNRNNVTIYNGRTPATISLKHSSGFFRRASYTVKLTMNGYENREVTIHSSLNAWYFGNVLFGGPLGLLIIDPATGAMYKLDTELVSETLSPMAAGTAQPASAGTLKIVALQDIPERFRKDLVKLP